MNVKISPIYLAIAAFILALGIVTWKFHQDNLVIAQYRPTKCLVTEKQIQTEQLTPLAQKTYRPTVKVKYTSTNNAAYITWVPALRIKPVVRSELYASSLLDNYPYGAFLNCWFDPQDPKIVVFDVSPRYLDQLEKLWLVIAIFMLLSTCILYFYKPDIARMRHDPLHPVRNKSNFMLVYYVRTGDAPVTKAMLPDELRAMGEGVQEKVVARLNADRRYLRVKFLAVFVVMVVGVLMGVLQYLDFKI